MEQLLIERIDSVKKRVISHRESMGLLTGSSSDHGRGFFKGMVEAQESEIKFLEKLLTHAADRPLTPDLMEEYGFIDDEPGVWFCQSIDSPNFADIRIVQNLRHQNRWQLHHTGANDEDEVTNLAGLDHLLAVLKEKGVEFEDEDEDEDEDNIDE